MANDNPKELTPEEVDEQLELKVRKLAFFLKKDMNSRMKLHSELWDRRKCSRITASLNAPDWYRICVEQMDITPHPRVSNSLTSLATLTIMQAAYKSEE